MLPTDLSNEDWQLGSLDLSDECHMLYWMNSGLNITIWKIWYISDVIVDIVVYIYIYDILIICSVIYTYTILYLSIT